MSTLRRIDRMVDLAEFRRREAASRPMISIKALER
jgi:hypothetical protein